MKPKLYQLTTTAMLLVLLFSTVAPLFAEQTVDPDIESSWKEDPTLDSAASSEVPSPSPETQPTEPASASNSLSETEPVQSSGIAQLPGKTALGAGVPRRLAGGIASTHRENNDPDPRPFEFQLASEILASPPNDTVSNLIFCPVSVSDFLGFLWACSAGKTASEIGSLFVPRSVSTEQEVGMLSDVGDAPLFPTVMAAGFSGSMALWMDAGFPLKPDFLASVGQFPGIHVGAAAFVTDPNQAVSEINRWLAKAMGGLGEHIVRTSDLTQPIRGVAMSATTFSGSWLTPFNPQNTSQSEFGLADGTTISTPFMSATVNAELAEPKGEGIRLISLPFQDSSVVLTILLPVCLEGETSGTALARVEKAFSFEKFNHWLACSKPTSCRLRMPRFEVAGKSAIVPALERLGVVAPFVSGLADFSKMSESAGSYISSLLQSARIRIDESGVDASAATIATITAKSFDSATLFSVEQPSLALLRDEKSGRLLFVARLASPMAPINSTGDIPRKSTEHLEEEKCE